jgi:Tfp pilus assembly protein PilO
MNEQIREALNKIPLIPLLLAYGGYLGYNYYTFTTDPNSDLNQKKAQIEQANQENKKKADKLKKAKEFFKTLEQRRADLRNYAIQLDQAKGSLSDEIDVSQFVRMFADEGKKVGLQVLAIKPTDSHMQEYYEEKSFDLKFKGLFIQLVVFMQHLTNMDRIIRISEISAKPIVAADSRYVVLEGNLELNVYRYRSSHADELVQASPASTPAAGGAAPAPNAAAKAPKPGGDK